MCSSGPHELAGSTGVHARRRTRSRASTAVHASHGRRGTDTGACIHKHTCTYTHIPAHAMVLTGAAVGCRAAAQRHVHRPGMRLHAAILRGGPAGASTAPTTLTTPTTPERATSTTVLTSAIPAMHAFHCCPQAGFNEAEQDFGSGNLNPGSLHDIYDDHGRCYFSGPGVCAASHCEMHRFRG